MLGRNGRGTVDHFGLHGRVDIQVGTLSKAIGALGGYVCGTAISSSSSTIAAAIPVLHLASAVGRGDLHRGLRRSGAGARTHRELVGEHALLEARTGRAGFNIGGVNTPASETPITPIIVGDGRLTMEFSRELFKEGVMGTGIAFPTVPEGKARIRTIVTATHTQEELDQALER